MENLHLVGGSRGGDSGSALSNVLPPLRQNSDREEIPWQTASLLAQIGINRGLRAAVICRIPQRLRRELT
jgi:hypothetical protein